MWKVVCRDAAAAPLFEREVQPSPNTAFAVLKIDRDVLSRAGGKLTFEFSVPILDFFGLWTPFLTRPSSKLDWIVRLESAFQRNFPYIGFFNRAGENAFAFGLTCIDDDVRILAKMNQQNCCYNLTTEVAVTSETEAFELLFASGRECWTDSVAAYRRKILGVQTFSFPEKAFRPVYCTWYAVHAALTQEYLARHSLLASQMGFGTFIVDDGWCIDAAKRVTPETLPVWYDRIGDWQVSSKKLPDMKKLVESAHRSGLSCLFWGAPFFLGTESDIYAGLPDKNRLMTPVVEGKQVLDPADNALTCRITEKILAVRRDLNLDGLKIDFIDYVPCSVETPRSRVVKRYVQSLVGELRRERPDALIEFRQRYATCATLPYATQFRAGDVPFDYFENLHRLVHIRLILGDGVPVHADPVYFHPDESPLNVARHMLCSLIGVPMVSMDLDTLSKEAAAVMRNYLAFYEAHRETLNFGHWRFSYDGDQLSWISAENNSEKIVFFISPALSPSSFADPDRQTIFLSLSDAPLSPPLGA